MFIQHLGAKFPEMSSTLLIQGGWLSGDLSLAFKGPEDVQSILPAPAVSPVPFLGVTYTESLH